MPKRQSEHGPKPEGFQLRAADIRVGQIIGFTGNGDPAKAGDWQVVAPAPEPSTFWLQRWFAVGAESGVYQTVKAHLYDLRSKSVVR